MTESDEALLAHSGAGQPVHVLCYRSRSLIEGPADRETSPVGRLIARAAAKNQRLGITGALLFDGGYFAQTLEGDRQAVQALFAEIERDPRHTDVLLAWELDRETRAFPDWGVCRIDLLRPDLRWLARDHAPPPGHTYTDGAIHDLRSMRLLVSVPG